MRRAQNRRARLRTHLWHRAHRHALQGVERIRQIRLPASPATYALRGGVVQNNFEAADTDKLSRVRPWEAEAARLLELGLIMPHTTTASGFRTSSIFSMPRRLVTGAAFLLAAGRLRALRRFLEQPGKGFPPCPVRGRADRALQVFGRFRNATPSCSGGSKNCPFRRQSRSRLNSRASRQAPAEERLDHGPVTV